MTLYQGCSIRLPDQYILGRRSSLRRTITFAAYVSESLSRAVDHDDGITVVKLVGPLEYQS